MTDVKLDDAQNSLKSEAFDKIIRDDHLIFPIIFIF